MYNMSSQQENRKNKIQKLVNFTQIVKNNGRVILKKSKNKIAGSGRC